MKKACVITEGQTDIDILKRVLPPSLTKEVEFVDGGGWSGAQSSAVTILAKRQIPVALVIDADANDEQTIHEKLDFSRWLLKQAAVQVPFEVFLAIPEVEAVFFQDQPFVEEIANRKFTDLEWRLMKLQPKELFVGSPMEKSQLLKRILGRLNQDSIKALQTHPLIKSLIGFLSSVVVENEEKQAA
ncbi:MAG: hypothetical protein SF097_01255 [Acidobacteriota bacterium]|nr:hypothetical protein [Acidobacteriota bacterium]